MDSQRRLIWHGMVLFLVGLLVGLAEGQVANPRMGLAAILRV
jgi:hydroxylaminobenzene mutase